MIRKARLGDARNIQKLINSYAEAGEMLPVSLSEIIERILEFVVYDEKDEILGCCAIHPSWEDLAEIRSVAVKRGCIKKGIGRLMVEECLSVASELGVKTVFLLTYQPGFFEKFGFEVVEKDTLPRKIWSDCLKCTKFPDCDEIAMSMEI
ncbi:N-acetyltransferase [Limisalsivibrio acetivorans]|uniref:N-acetyltransferase n=1 Tax=Limisalsivibrio acetivorans TaxID=1304888 RepID=UPI0003B47E5A|nr:N-acetyltransferase [Limisalsivibrio acetivorans]